MMSEISHLKETLIGLCSITKVISEIIFNLKESNGSLQYCKHLHKRNCIQETLG